MKKVIWIIFMVMMGAANVGAQTQTFQPFETSCYSEMYRSALMTTTHNSFRIADSYLVNQDSNAKLIAKLANEYQSDLGTLTISNFRWEVKNVEGLCFESESDVVGGIPLFSCIQSSGKGNLKILGAYKKNGVPKTFEKLFNGMDFQEMNVTAKAVKLSSEEGIQVNVSTFARQRFFEVELNFEVLFIPTVSDFSGCYKPYH